MNEYENPRRHNEFIEFVLSSIKYENPKQKILEQSVFESGVFTVNEIKRDMSKYRRIHLIGAGKGAAGMAEGMVELLGDRIFGGIVVTYESCFISLHGIKFYPGDHPLPGSQSVRAARAVVDYLKYRVCGTDLVIFLISGGASAMMAYPVEGISINQLREINNALIKSGAGISEINRLRKRISRVKGGQLLSYLGRAESITLIVSDIVDSPAEDIGSGPTVYSGKRNSDPVEILSKYELNTRLKPETFRALKLAIYNAASQTDPVSERYLQANSRYLHTVLSDNNTLLRRIKSGLKTRGFNAQVFSPGENGPLSRTVDRYYRLFRDTTDNSAADGRVFIGGGEPVLRVDGDGKGGRNTHFALALLNIFGQVDHPFFFLSIGSDGIDGPTNAAGAWFDHLSFEKAKKLGLNADDYLKRFDAYRYFEALGQLILTGPSGNNLLDVRLLSIE